MVILIYPAFHVFFPYAVVVGTKLDLKAKIHRIAFPIALILPDLVDKLFMWTVGSTGRDWAHNLLYVCLCAVPFLVAKKYSIGWSVWLGQLIHLLLDVPGVPWLFPFVQYDFGYGGIAQHLTFWEYFIQGLSQPIAYWTEIIGLACLVLLMAKYRLKNWPAIKNFLSFPATQIQRAGGGLEMGKGNAGM